MRVNDRVTLTTSINPARLDNLLSLGGNAGDSAMLNKICLWIAGVAAFICLAPLLAYAVSVHSDFGSGLAQILKENTNHTVDD